MMETSQHQIDFIAAITTRLLSVGDMVPQSPVLTVKQAEKRYSPIGAEWSEGHAEGGGVVSVAWSTVRDHASHGAMHSYCMRHAASIPSGQTGTLRITISGGEVWDVQDAVISSSAPLPLADSGTYESITAYSASGGRMVPASAITIYAGIPWDFLVGDWDALSTDWDNF